MFTNDPKNSPYDRIRLMIADWDNNDIALSQEVLEFLYTKNQGNERKAAIEALGYLLLEYAKYSDEKVGGVYVRDRDRYKNFKDALNELRKGGMGFRMAAPYAGGISVSDRDTRKNNPDNFPHSIDKGWTSAPADQGGVNTFTIRVECDE